MKFPCDYIVHCEPIEKGTKVTVSGWKELIRCRDCKYREWDVIDVPYGQTKRIEWCSIRYNTDGENVETTPKGFCSKAEPKENER